MAKFFDAHTHAQFAAFEHDWKEVIDRALREHVWMINVGTQKDTSEKAIEVAHKYEEGVYATVGLHPIHTEKSYHDVKELGMDDKAREFTSRGEDFDYDVYKKLAQDPKVVAIGECGLDYYRLGEETKKKQKEVFLKHIELAHEVAKPLMIHCRNAFPDLIEILTSNIQRLTSNSPGVVHFFTGAPDDAKKLLALGFSFTFGGVITFARNYDEAIKMIPLDRILSETDAPYVAPVPYRGKRNEPAYVIEVVKKLAELKDVPVEKMERQIFTNAKNIFNI
ncbi:MAG: TatD family hydrolase [Candidatus Liptonbacteria bacterium]|nr:TatD family hydrolase [Candidatus Liptonbacteria bacterium]